jgi:uncharacterized membrane protein
VGLLGSPGTTGDVLSLVAGAALAGFLLSGVAPTTLLCGFVLGTGALSAFVFVVEQSTARGDSPSALTIWLGLATLGLVPFALGALTRSALRRGVGRPVSSDRGPTALP